MGSILPVGKRERRGTQLEKKVWGRGTTAGKKSLGEGSAGKKLREGHTEVPWKNVWERGKKFGRGVHPGKSLGEG